MTARIDPHKACIGRSEEAIPTRDPSSGWGREGHRLKICSRIELPDRPGTAAVVCALESVRAKHISVHDIGEEDRTNRTVKIAVLPAYPAVGCRNECAVTPGPPVGTIEKVCGAKIVFGVAF